jgi:hypothetical protein
MAEIGLDKDFEAFLETRQVDFLNQTSVCIFYMFFYPAV